MHDVPGQKIEIEGHLAFVPININYPDGTSARPSDPLPLPGNSVRKRLMKDLQAMGKRIGATVPRLTCYLPRDLWPEIGSTLKYIEQFVQRVSLAMYIRSVDKGTCHVGILSPLGLGGARILPSHRGLHRCGPHSTWLSSRKRWHMQEIVWSVHKESRRLDRAGRGNSTKFWYVTHEAMTYTIMFEMHNNNFIKSGQGTVASGWMHPHVWVVLNAGSRSTQPLGGLHRQTQIPRAG